MQVNREEDASTKILQYLEQHGGSTNLHNAAIARALGLSCLDAYSAICLLQKEGMLRERNNHGWLVLSDQRVQAVSF